MITTVTFTGADDSILPELLFEISKQFPFVEWAILVSRKSTGLNRFPSMRWIKELVDLQNKKILAGSGNINLSLHLCGDYVHEILDGNGDFIDEDLVDIWDAFSRVQINTHGEKHMISETFTELLEEHPNKEFIFQYDYVNTRMIELAMESEADYSALFDLSHGTGELPGSWPELLPGVKCGYAGGLAPENIVHQIKLIEDKAGEVKSWIDMETHVRSFDNRVFDLTKVRDVLLRVSEAYPYIKS